MFTGSPKVTRLKALKNSARNSKVVGSERAPAAQGGVLDQGHVEIVKVRATEGVSSQGSEAALVGPGAARNIYGDGKKGGVVRTSAEVVLPDRAAGGEIRSRQLIGPVGSRRAHAGLLNAGIDGERRAGGERRDVEDLPARKEFLSQGPEKIQPFQRQHLNDARRKRLRHVKG